MFDQLLLASSKKLKLCPIYIIFPFKQENICDYNPRCFMSSGLILDDIIMNLFTDITKQKTYSVKKHLFSKIHDDTIYLYKGSLQDYSWKNEFLIQKYITSHRLTEKKHLGQSFNCLEEAKNHFSNIRHVYLFFPLFC